MASPNATSGAQASHDREIAAQSDELRQLSATLRSRLAGQVGKAGLAERDVELRFYPHFDEPLETAPGPALSIRLIGRARTANGTEIGTDVYVISHPEPDKFEVRRLSSAKLIGEDIGWPRRGMPDNNAVDRLLAMGLTDLIEAQRPAA